MLPIPAIEIPWWKKLLFLLLETLGFVAIATLVVLLLDQLISPLTLAVAPLELRELFKEWGITLLAVFSAAYLLNLFARRPGLAEMGFTTARLGYSLGTGLWVGSSILVLCFLLLWVGGWVQITAFLFEPPLFWGWLLFFLIQPLAEEIVMRSFLQAHLQHYFGPQVALLGAALVFGLLHAGNDAFTWLAGLEIVLGGYLMGQLYLHTQSIWAPFALHASWNFLQSTVLGFAVSGMDTYRLLQLDINGPEWLTGGEFGLEGSLLTVILLGVAIAYFKKRNREISPLPQA